MNADEVIAVTRRAWAPAMAPEEYGAFLNELLAAERAGAKLLAAWLDELPLESPRWRAIREVQRDEARNCALLIHLLLEAEETPTPAVGTAYGRGLALRDWGERLRFLNRVQARVAQRIAEALERVPRAARDILQRMHESHVANVRRCEGLL